MTGITRVYAISNPIRVKLKSTLIQFRAFKVGSKFKSHSESYKNLVQFIFFSTRNVIAKKLKRFAKLSIKRIFFFRNSNLNSEILSQVI